MKKVKVIDITMFMGDWTYPGDKPFSLGYPYSALGPKKEFCYNFSTNSVEGTHIQSPHYVFEKGKSINDFPVDYFRREAVVLDLRNVKENFIPGDLLRQKLEKYNLKDRAVIFHTGVMDQLIKGKNVKDKLLKPEDAKYLLSKGIKMIVTDTTCLDDPLFNKGECPTTKLCCQNDVVLVKQVCNLHKISKTNVIVEAYPLKIRGISGTPCRAVVIE